jgi:hypothetical protein
MVLYKRLLPALETSTTRIGMVNAGSSILASMTCVSRKISDRARLACGWILWGALQCYLRKLCIFGKIFHPLFSLFSPVQILWLRLAALRQVRISTEVRCAATGRAGQLTL